MTAAPVPTQAEAGPVLRVASYNIHKGVQGLGPARRLEIHNLALAVEALDADLVCLQEVRRSNRREARYFSAWPQQAQADYLAPAGYEAVYATNATTRHGEHGNALLSRWPVLAHWQEDVSDHRFEQRGLLYVKLCVHQRPVHALVVHFGLLPASRRRQAERLRAFVRRHIPADEPVLVAGDFNDWGTRVQRLLAQDGLRTWEGARTPTYPSRWPVAQLDHVYARGLSPLACTTPSGRVWQRMSDHLPLIADFQF